MGNIVILDEITANKIAAGEVIERPASVVKELIENSIDAGSASISIEIKNGGISLIKVSDNGSGMEEDDAVIAFERHGTSKIRHSDDLDAISTLGFRGEALASIASVAKVQLTTRIQENTHGMYVEIHGGDVKDVRQTGCPVGTTFVIKDLFFNTPARYKFLKKDTTEAGYISDIISRVALGNPQISFRFTSNNSMVLHTPGNNDLLSTIFSIYGKDTARQLKKVDFVDTRIKITGYAGKPEIARSNRNHQTVYINGRYIKSKVVTAAIDEAYKTMLMKNKYAFVVLMLELNPVLVDVNVHPAKMEVRFSNEQDIFRSVYHAVINALQSGAELKRIHPSDNAAMTFRFEKSDQHEAKYKQETIGSGSSLIKEQVLWKSPQHAMPESQIITQEIRNNADKSEKDKEQKHQNALLEGKQHQKNNQQHSIPEKSQDYYICKDNETFGKAKELNVEKKGTEWEEGCHNISANSEEGNNEVSELCDARIIGQAFSTYIILQKDDRMILVDQHAAHERIIYARILKKFRSCEQATQILLEPIVIEMTHQEIKLLEDKKKFFNSIGFTYENFGNNSIILRSVPYSDLDASVKEIFLELVDNAMTSVKGEDNAIAEEALYTIACKAAVKANKRLDELEIRALLKELACIENPYTCPHGRPTVIQISRYDMEKLFKRIV